MREHGGAKEVVSKIGSVNDRTDLIQSNVTNVYENANAIKGEAVSGARFDFYVFAPGLGKRCTGQQETAQSPVASGHYD